MKDCIDNMENFDPVVFPQQPFHAHRKQQRSKHRDRFVWDKSERTVRRKITKTQGRLKRLLLSVKPSICIHNSHMLLCMAS